MASRTQAASIVAGIGALAAWAALVVQLAITLRFSLDQGRTLAQGVAIYLGYFTILTNLLVAVALSGGATSPGSAFGRLVSRPGVVTTVAVAIVFVGGGYHVLLSSAWNPEGWVLAVNVVLHYVTPAVFLVYWWLKTADRRLSWTIVPLSAVYPLAYFVYVLARGAVTGFYPYPFLDVARLGYGRVFAHAAGLAAGYLLLSAALVALGRWRAALR